MNTKVVNIFHVHIYFLFIDKCVIKITILKFNYWYHFRTNWTMWVEIFSIFLDFWKTKTCLILTSNYLLKSCKFLEIFWFCFHVDLTICKCSVKLIPTYLYLDLYLIEIIVNFENSIGRNILKFLEIVWY